MHTENGTLYPMLAVGAFMAMFWTGFVAGHALGLGCFPMFVTGLVCACVGTIGVCELQRRDLHGTAEDPRRAVRTRDAVRRAAPHPVPVGSGGRRPGAVVAAARAGAAPC